jgi:hypothetical protein
LSHRGSQLLRRERRHGNASALAMQRLPGTWFSVTLAGPATDEKKHFTSFR